MINPLVEVDSFDQISCLEIDHIVILKIFQFYGLTDDGNPLG